MGWGAITWIPALFICHPPAGARSRYPHDSGITRAQRYKNYNDLHPCAQPRPAGRLQPCRSFVTRRTLIGGPAHQTRNGSDLSELLVIASDLTGAFRLLPDFRRPKLRRRGYYAGPPKTCWEVKGHQCIQAMDPCRNFCHSGDTSRSAGEADPARINL